MLMRWEFHAHALHPSAPKLSLGQQCWARPGGGDGRWGTRWMRRAAALEQLTSDMKCARAPQHGGAGMGMGTEGWSPSWLRELGPPELGTQSQSDRHLKGRELEGALQAEGSFESRGQYEEGHGV